MLPRLEIVRRIRPVDLLAPGDVRLEVDSAGLHDMPVPAPYVTAVSPAHEGARLALHLDGTRLGASYDAGAVSLTVGSDTHRSRRHGRAEDPTELGLTLTGPHLTAWTREAGRWVARARRDLTEDRSTSGRALDVRAEGALARLQVETPARGGRAGGFGQLGLRDVRVVSSADGTPWREDGDLWLTATSAGPGHFDSGHTSVWRLSPGDSPGRSLCGEPRDLRLSHAADLFFRRPDRPGVFGDHATHLVRDGGRWLVATSTWGDFVLPTTRAGRRTASSLRVTLAESGADLLRGSHVLDTRELPLPVDGMDSIATWDPHLLRRDRGWVVGYVSARRFFSFHPAVAAGPSLDDLELRGVALDRTATEGTTLLDVDGSLLVLASDGRDGPRGRRRAYPVFDASMTQVGALEAPYPTNLPWPTLVREGDRWLMLAFNGRPAGGGLLGYGTHGDLVVMRSV